MAGWVTTFLKRATNSGTVIIKLGPVNVHVSTEGLVMASNSLVGLRFKEIVSLAAVKKQIKERKIEPPRLN